MKALRADNIRPCNIVYGNLCKPRDTSSQAPQCDKTFVILSEAKNLTAFRSMVADGDLYKPRDTSSQAPQCDKTFVILSEAKNLTAFRSMVADGDLYKPRDTSVIGFPQCDNPFD